MSRRNGGARETVNLIPIVSPVGNLRDALFQKLFRAAREGERVAKLSPESAVEMVVTLSAAIAKIHGWPVERYLEIARRAFVGLKVNVRVDS